MSPDDGRALPLMLSDWDFIDVLRAMVNDDIIVLRQICIKKATKARPRSKVSKDSALISLHYDVSMVSMYTVRNQPAPYQHSSFPTHSHRSLLPTDRAPRTSCERPGIS